MSPMSACLTHQETEIWSFWTIIPCSCNFNFWKSTMQNFTSIRYIPRLSNSSLITLYIWGGTILWEIKDCPRINKLSFTCLCPLEPRWGEANVMKFIGSNPAILPSKFLFSFMWWPLTGVPLVAGSKSLPIAYLAIRPPNEWATNEIFCTPLLLFTTEITCYKVNIMLGQTSHTFAMNSQEISNKRSSMHGKPKHIR